MRGTASQIATVRQCRSAATAPPTRPRALLRSFVPADFLTLGNAACGTGAIFFCLNYLEAGRVTTRTWWGPSCSCRSRSCSTWPTASSPAGDRHSPFGADLDSLADVVSFGVAPAVLGFTLGMRGGWDALVLCAFVCCGVSRLARYNVTAASLSDGTGKVKYYEGTPIPTSLVIVALLALAWWRGDVGDALWLGKHRLGRRLLPPAGAALRDQRLRRW